jgi:hypothetical protein
MSKVSILCFFLFSICLGCKEKCKDEQPEASCQGQHVFTNGNCHCPENSVDMGNYVCKPYSKNNFWLQEGDPCLGQAYFFFGKSGTDIFDDGQSTIEMSWTQGISGTRLGGSFQSIDKIANQYYLISCPFNDVNHFTDDFKECIGKDYNYYDLELKIDLDWTTADVTYKFWNDVDTSVHIKKEFGKELKAVFMSNTGPK